MKKWKTNVMWLRGGKKGDTEDYAEIRATFMKEVCRKFFLEKNKKFTKTDARKNTRSTLSHKQ